jgi:hypothetical protein
LCREEGETVDEIRDEKKWRVCKKESKLKDLKYNNPF